MSLDFKTYSHKNVLVTGAKGFIGPHVCRKLAELGANVFAVARNIKDPFDDDVENIQVVKADFSKLEVVEEIFNKIKPDYTFHLAGLAAGGRGLNFIEPTFQSNLVTSINVLKTITEKRPGRLIIIGSMEEPASKEIEAIPSSPYAASKWAASSYARMFHKLYETDVVIARLFMTYGPGNQPPKKLLPYVINSLLENESPKLGSGSRLIDWVYIDDVVDGLLTLGLTGRIEGKTLDIGTGTLIATLDFVQTIREIVESNIEISFGQIEDRKMEQEKKADVETTFKTTGWKPRVSLKEGLAKTVDWYRNQRKPVFH